MSESARPLVSVIVPTHNRADLVGDALRSILTQTFRDFEIIVVDNGSTDGTDKVIAALHDPRIRYHWQENSGLPANSRNVGIGMARGRYVAFLDSDDLWTARKLDDQLAVMAAHPDLVLVHSMVQNIGGDGPRVEVSPLPWRAAVTRKDLEEGKSIPCLTVLMSREVLNRLGGFDEDPKLRAIEDYDLWYRASNDGPFGFIPKIHGVYRVHAGGLFGTIEARNSRLAYLQAKRGMPRAPYMLSPRKPSFLRNQLRCAVHMIVLAWIECRQGAGRALGRGVPVYRSTDIGRRLYDARPLRGG